MQVEVHIQREPRAQTMCLSGTRPALVLRVPPRRAGCRRGGRVGTGVSGESCVLSSALVLRIQPQGSEPSSAQLEKEARGHTHVYRDSQPATRASWLG